MTGQPPPTSSPHAYRYPRAMRENGSQQNPYGSRTARLSGGPDVPNCELRAARSARNRAAASERRGRAIRRDS